MFDVAGIGLDLRPRGSRALSNGVVETYEHVFAALLGAELTQKQGVIFRFLARLLLAIPDATLHTFRDSWKMGTISLPHAIA